MLITCSTAGCHFTCAGSKLFEAILEWAAKEQEKSDEASDPELVDGRGEESGGHLLVLSAQEASEARNWWLRRLRKYNLQKEWKEAHSCNELRQRTGTRELPKGLCVRQSDACPPLLQAW